MYFGDSAQTSTFGSPYSGSGSGVGTGLISALGSVVSTGINAWSQNSINNDNIKYNTQINEANLQNQTDINNANIAANEKINQDNINATAEQNLLNRQHDNDMAQLSYSLNEQAAVNDYERSKEAWNMENAYNDPSAQRARLEAAGVNPAVAFGSGVSTTSGNSNQMADSSAGGASVSSTPGQVPTLRAAYRQATKLNSIMQSAPYLDPQAFLAVSQARLFDSQANKNNKEADAVDFTTRLQDAQAKLFESQTLTEQQKEMALSLQNSLDSITMGMKQENLHLSNEKLKSDITTAVKNWDKIASEIGKNNAWVSLTAGQLAVQQKLANSNVKLNDAQIDHLSEVAANLYSLTVLNEEKTNTQRHLTTSAEIDSKSKAIDLGFKETKYNDDLRVAFKALGDMIDDLIPAIIKF